MTSQSTKPRSGAALLRPQPTLRCPSGVGQLRSALLTGGCLLCTPLCRQSRYFSLQAFQGSIIRPICSHLDHFTLDGIACFFVFFHSEKYHRIPLSLEWLNFMGAVPIKNYTFLY